uniref:C2H2-type domain-containing protein n=1 Tax=Setaria italica TaxID=4555 RepID=K3Z7P7_SETIT
MLSRGSHKHLCKVCTKNFRSGRALGGHMSCHRHAGMQQRSTPCPPAIVVDVPVSLLGPSDEKPSLPCLETQWWHLSQEFSTNQSLRGNMRMHSEKKVMAKPNEEPAGLMEASANANGDHGHHEMLFSPVKRKRSKRGMPALDSEMCAADALLMLAKYSDKSYAYEDCCGGDNNDNISTPNLLKEVNLNAFDQLVQSDEFTNSTRLKSDKNSAYEGFYEHTEQESSLNLAADTEMLLNVFDHGLDVDADFMKPGADISVEELQSSDLSASVNIKRHHCKVCGKVLGSGHALGGHMRLHYVRKCNLHQGVADCTNSTMMEEQMQKLELKSPIFYRRRPRSHWSGI